MRTLLGVCLTFSSCLAMDPAGLVFACNDTSCADAGVTGGGGSVTGGGTGGGSVTGGGTGGGSVTGGGTGGGSVTDGGTGGGGGSVTGGGTGGGGGSVTGGGTGGGGGGGSVTGGGTGGGGGGGSVTGGGTGGGGGGGSVTGGGTGGGGGAVTDAGTGDGGAPACAPSTPVLFSALTRDFNSTCQNYPYLVSGKFNHTMARVDADPAPDLVTFVSTPVRSGVQAFEWNGTSWLDGGFTQTDFRDGGFASNPWFDGLVALDLTGDGLSELVMLSFDQYAVLTNQGGGQYAVGPKVRLSPTSISSSDVRVADFNHDCLDDVVIMHPNNQGRITVLFNGGNGAFSSSLVFKVAGSNSSATSMDLGDFDQDRHLDVAVTTRDELRIFWGEGDGGIALKLDGGPGPSSISISDGAGAEVTAVDWQHDGRSEVFLVLPGGEHVLYSVAGRTFTALPLTSTLGSVRNPLLAGDLDADGKPDLLFQAASTPVPLWSLNLNTAWAPPMNATTAPPVPTSLDSWLATDLTNDRRIDTVGIATVDFSDKQTTWLCTSLGVP